MLYVLLTNGFTILSIQTIEEVGATIITHKKSFFKNHKMGRLKLESFFLDNKNKLKVRRKDTCVIDYLWHEVKGKRGFKTYTYEKLSEELIDFAESYPFMSTQEIIDWVQECHSNISVHAYTSTYKKFIKHIFNTPDIVLTFFVQDHHLHPITDPELKRVASSCNQKGSINLFEHMSELKWSRRHEQFVMYENIDNEIQNHIIVCPPEMQVKTAVCEYMQKSNYYVEYLHFNNNGQLDGFLDHKNNMYVENNDYETRKKICDKLFNIYYVDDFMWANQSYTALANSLFIIMIGYLPESSYNNKTRKILDDYYPKAIQWCSFEDQPENLVNIDICKQFPSILVQNGITIPVYNIHDCIEKFEGKQEMDNDIGLYCPELNNNGEFYINEYTIKYFGVPLKIEAGFYHISLIDFLVYELKMPISNIKYKLIAHHGLKCDTFKEFITYIFENFPESEAKKMSNSFIGELR